MKNSSLYMLTGSSILLAVILLGLFVPFISVILCGFGVVLGAAIMICGILSTLGGN